ncbi:UL36 very large tegument protein [Streptomyces sp. NBC_00320]|uniref:UL36 very large tegument protein n=1 Tax=unclassified Streptomyces TaxID=2593676 RepID=UPI00225A564E|nr:UL36 very large tegument protein [Streptomyces sp. NBC_00320]MCX5150449.1 UL36 very large tegument protein [Streptomyces sp. NBC_00320]
METATSLVIGQLSGYLRGLTQRLDPGAGWYGEFLRRDPEGLRACLDGAAMPPWDVLESLLGDLAGARGAESAQREMQYAARLRAVAVAVWDRLPGGAEELRTLLAAAADQRAVSEAATRTLTARLAATTDRTEAEALAGELAWIRDDAARAAARQQDLASRLTALSAPAPEPAGQPASRSVGPEAADAAQAPGAWAGVGDGGPLPGVPRQREAGEDRAEPPVGRAEGRWLRGARRAGGARYAGAAAPEASAPFTPPPGLPDAAAAPPRGARFGRPDPEPAAPLGTIGRARFAPARPEVQYADGPRPASPEAQAPSTAWDHFAPPQAQVQAAGGGLAAAEPARRSGGAVAGVVGQLVALRAQGRSGEAHAVLCEAAAGPAERLPAWAAELARAGLGADWATLLWEAASLPPERLAAAAAALGEAGRHADCEALLRQGAARPAAEIADAALALAAVGRTHEADALLGAFVKVRTAEEAVRLARRDPQWFTPRLLRAAEALSGTHHRDLVHALRVAKPPVH